MTRPTLLAFIASLLFVAACSSTANDAVPDGGTRNPDGGLPDGGAPDGGVPDGGTPLATLRCEEEGYPCSPAEQTDEGRDLSEHYKAEIQDRLAAGDTYLDIGDWLRGQDGVVDVVAAGGRLRFRVEGGSPQWAYSTNPGHPQATLPPLAEVSVATKSKPALETAVEPKRIVREDNSDTKVKKKGLILEPFQFQLLSNAPQWKQSLERLHDYNEVTHLANNTIPDFYFGNWDDYRFVWVLSHGAYLPEGMPEYTAIFSSKECGMNRWIALEVIAGRGTEPLANQDPLASILGLPRNSAEARLTTTQRGRWKSFLDAEAEELENKGQGCGFLKMDDVVLPVVDGDGNVIVRSPAFLDFIYYDDDWFTDHYSARLHNVVLYLSICSSSAVPIFGQGGGRPSAIFGWSNPVGAAEDDLATDVLFERLITQGEMVKDAFAKVTDAGLHQTALRGQSTELSYVGLGGGDRARVREIVTIIDKETGEAFPDTGGFIDTREITSAGSTEFDVTVSIVGFGKRSADDFKVQIFNQDGQALSPEYEVDNPVDGTTVMTIGASVNQEIRSATDIELEARVKLPEESGDVYSKHPIEVTLFPAIEAAWTLNVAGAGTARGDFVFSPFPVAVEDDEGNLFWQVSLLQADESPVPSATVLIRDHPGRSPECTGPLGNFDAIVTVQYTVSTMPTEGFGGGLGAGECGDFVNVEIVSFSREDDLVANVSGIICHWRRVGDDVVVTPVPINGRFQMPQAGCGMDPGGDLLGSYYASQAPDACIDVYPNAAIAPAWDEVCSMGGGIVCSDEPCSTAGQIGQCDYRSAAVSISFRGQIHHFLPGGDWPPASDLQGACELQLGTWTTGAPTP